MHWWVLHSNYAKSDVVADSQCATATCCCTVASPTARHGGRMSVIEQVSYFHAEMLLLAVMHELQPPHDCCHRRTVASVAAMKPPFIDALPQKFHARRARATAECLHDNDIRVAHNQTARTCAHHGHHQHGKPPLHRSRELSIGCAPEARTPLHQMCDK